MPASVRSSRARARPRERGASLVEALVLVGLVGMLGVGANRAFGTTVATRADGQTENVRAMSRGAGFGGATCTSGNCGVVGSNCFAAGTLVATPSGPQPIDRITAGDVVVSEDERTGEVVTRTVSATFVTDDADVLDLFIDGEADPLRVTPGHRVFTLDRGWLSTKDLVPGEALVTPDGTPVRVDHLEREIDRVRVYNFEVEGTHTYFVGPKRILVHNPIVDNGTHFTNRLNPKGPRQSYWAPPDGRQTCIVSTFRSPRGDGTTFSDHAQDLPGAKVYGYNDLKPGDLKGCVHLVLDSHGTPGLMLNPEEADKKKFGLVKKGDPNGAQVAERLAKMGYDPPEDAEIFVGLCNAATACTPATKKASTSVADAIASRYRGRKVFGASSDHPALATAGVEGPGLSRTNEGFMDYVTPSGMLSLDYQWKGPHLLSVSDGHIAEIVHDPGAPAPRRCQAVP